MKSIITVLLIFYTSLTSNISAQILNGGFEEWETVQNFEKPKFWNTNQDANFVRFEKDTLSVEGNYSLKVVPSAFSAWQECNSIASMKVRLPMTVGEDRSLTFYVKSTPLIQFEPVFLRVRGKFFDSGNFDSNYEWETFDKIEEFTKIQIPITNPNIDSLTITIIGGALNGATDGCHNYSLSWIDGISIEGMNITKTDKEVIRQENEVVLYPNPSSGIIEIVQNNIRINKFQLFTINGELLESGNCNGKTLKVNSKINGVFILKLIQEKEGSSYVISKQIVIK